MTRTKKIITLGPATSNEEALREILPTVDLVRFNFSFGEHSWHKEVLTLVEKIRNEKGLSLATMADLQGPKIRLGEFEGMAEMLDGEEVGFTGDKSKSDMEKKIFFVDYPEIAHQVKVGEQILLDNGFMELTITDISNGVVRAHVDVGGKFRARRTVNLPGVKVNLPILTDKDRKDLDFIVEESFDYIALSFVRFASDVLELREILRTRAPQKKILSKIEDSEGTHNYSSIVDVSDGMIIARGDLGAEIPLESLPAVQKEMIEKALIGGKIVAVATHTLESMIHNPRPTRAEVTDVANAVWQGADSVWLSAETSVGKHPARAIRWLEKILKEAEKSIDYEHTSFLNIYNGDPRYVILSGAVNIAHSSDADAIVVITKTGKTAVQTSSFRPKAEIIAYCDSDIVKHQLALAWGVSSHKIDSDLIDESSPDVMEKVLADLKEKYPKFKRVALVVDTQIGEKRNPGIQLIELGDA